jgi:PelA/Pel-15E family pectate lyase
VGMPLLGRTLGAAAILLAFVGAAAAAEDAKAPAVPWKSCLKQKPAWYAGDGAVRIADNVLLYQRDSGGWPKNLEMAAVLSDPEKAALAAQKPKTDSTIDNGATYTQMAYLARVYQAAKHERFKAAFLKGLDYLLSAQYENGGWPQFYPKPSGYSTHITFNDDAMIGVMKLLRDIARNAPAYAFVDDDRRARAEKAVARGLDCILKCQIVTNGRRTAWCAQHDEKTLAPASARSYEKASLSGAESVGIVRFLMDIDRPSPEVIQAVQSAVAWFNEAKLTGIRQVAKPDPSLPGGTDKVVVADPSAEPLWARFYEIGTNRPIFCGRDGVIKYTLAEIEHERRTGYAWYVGDPGGLLAKEYPAWQAKWARAGNVPAK